MPEFRVRRATVKDVDALVRQRHMMFEDMRHRTPEEHRIGDEAYGKWAIEMLMLGYTRHINLGFWMGTQLHSDLLEGTGKGIRHIRIRSEAEVRTNETELVRLIKQAISLVRG